MSRLATLLLGVAPLLLAGCNAPVSALLAQANGPAVRGSGTVKEESREVPAFRTLRADGTLQVTYTPGDLAPVTITADDNILPLVVAEVTDGGLRLGFKPNTSIQPSQPVRVAVTAPAPERIAVSGASGVTIPKGLAAPSLTLALDGAGRLAAPELEVTALTLDLQGASHATLGGRSEAIILRGSGAARIDAGKLAATTARIELSGASAANLSGVGQITGDLSGAASVEAASRDAAAGVRTSGAGGVRVR